MREREKLVRRGMSSRPGSKIGLAVGMQVIEGGEGVWAENGWRWLNRPRSRADICHRSQVVSNRAVAASPPHRGGVLSAEKNKKFCHIPYSTSSLPRIKGFSTYHHS